jgi:hypothetical protein
MPDLIIDYPNSKLYIQEIFKKSVECGIMQKETAENYEKHIESLDE